MDDGAGKIMPVRPPKSWSSTLRLPKSSFPPRTSVEDQARYLKRCTDDLYAWQSQARASQQAFILHDGPPYANGSLHIGHALNKILKDLICRAELHQGRRIQFVPGWDCHGLPIEIKALEKDRSKNENEAQHRDPVGIRAIARDLATKTVQEQKDGFRKWAIMADWDKAWTTMDKEFELKQLGIFQEMVKQGLIFRRFKPVYWSPSSRTALAEAELEYKEDHVSTAAFIKFPVSSIPRGLEEKGADPKILNAVIWTTTPWTLPANMAIAIHPDLDYTIVEKDGEQLLIGKSRLEHVAKISSWEDSPTVVVDSVKGSDLVGTTYVNSLKGKSASPQPLLVAEYVTADTGSGLVHCAPGHGMEDYDLCIQHGIPAFAPLDDAGRFTEAALPDDPETLTGRSVLKDGSAKVLEILGPKVLATHKIRHKYPYDWRTKLPVILRATEQWFADVGSIKDDALHRLKAVKFIPEAGRARIESFVKGRSEWCISRQRAWGVPIPALYDTSGNAVLTEESVAHIISVIDKKGIDAWWTDAEEDPSWIAPGLTGTFRRGKDTMDVWFDSGTSWTQTDGQADVYSEGSDQHRGWFQSSLLTHASASGLSFPPFKTLITHGFTLDQNGKKMSKSIGNVIAPEQIMDGSLLPPMKRKGKGPGPPQYDGLGADALRLWVASSDYTRDVIIGQPVLKSINSVVSKYRTTIKMLLGSMKEDHADLPVTKLDKIALYQLRTAMVAVHEAWRSYDFHKAVNVINRWINIDLSSFYLEAMKDRLYCGDGGGILYHAYIGLLQMLSPVTPALVEEAWEHRPQWLKDDSQAVHPLQQVLDPKLPILPGLADQLEDIASDVPWLMHANSAIKAAQEEARGAKLVGSSLQSSVVLQLPSSAKEVFLRYEDELEAMFVVSHVRLAELGEAVPTEEWKYTMDFEAPGGKGTAWVLPPRESKCPRCWRYVAPAEDELCKRCESVVPVNLN